ncbi:proline iminopeptidase-family hydrolase [Nonomuraea basaltis]|uniref:proline iminopeptidase-family hydrolase n=1 Tax=Nonomuraea basaltis TaxID=2495887 RepID=UPI00110C5DBB|nr:proline iminopeptidase-family hydrolase [Nonomuraea basaltis]TMR91929.1 alpha/beta fold hydrolase [Nonomuraea basaltis]
MSRRPTAKGTVPFREYRTWYRVSGDLSGGRPPLVVLHGGPGSTHDYLLPLCELSDAGQPVIHYDQLGNGGSTHLPEKGADFWTVRLFLDELDNLLGRLGVADGYLIFGHSWGGMLGAAHAATRPRGLRGLIIANSPASMPTWRAEMVRLRATLPREVQETLARHEATGTTDSRAYFDAMRVFFDRYVCLVNPWPREYRASFMEMHNNPTVYYTMNGPTEFHVVGTLRDWSVVELLPSIGVPTLIISGRHDEATPESVRPFRDLIPDSHWEILENSSHLPHLEEPDRFREVLLAYLATVHGTHPGTRASDAATGS